MTRQRPFHPQFQRNGIYFRRFWWWYPWTLSSPWKPDISLGGDEWCNIPVCITVPGLGCFLFYILNWPLRDMPCPDEWALLDDEGRQEYLPGGELYGGR